MKVLPFPLDGKWLTDSTLWLGKTAIFQYNTAQKAPERNEKRGLKKTPIG